MPSPDITLEEIGTWLAANTGFSKGTTLQIQHRLQSAPDRCIVIANNGGGGLYQYPPRKRIDYMLQVMSRAVEWDEARDDIWEIHKFLFEDGTSHINLPTSSPKFKIENIMPIGAPQSIGQDKTGRYEYSTNYTLFCFRL